MITIGIILISPENGETVDICAKYQHEFDSCNTFRKQKKFICSILDKTKSESDNTTPAPVKFEWKGDNEFSVLEISEHSGFVDSIKYQIKGNKAEIYNLKKDTLYYWRVDNSEVFSFITDALMPRWIYADGIGNVRDMGGRRNAEGKRIKQGLIYRGFRLENGLTEKGKNQLIELGIKTELDLREEVKDKQNTSIPDINAEYILNPCKGYDEFINEDITNGNCRKIMEFFADGNNYPIYFHCAGGQDRTGTIAFLLDAILGLEDEDMLKEYELTMLSSPMKNMSRSRKGKFKPFLKYIRKTGNKKNSLRDNTILFLKNAGVTDETMVKIRNLLLE